MADQSQNAQELASMVSMLVTPLVEQVDKLEVLSSEEDGVVYVDIKVAEEDAGKIIGRGGRVIKSVRTLTRAAGSRRGVDVEVELAD
jgi:hypothetical protein